MKRHLCAASILLACLNANGEVIPEVEGTGGLRAIRVDGQPIPVRIELRVATEAWAKMAANSKWGTRDSKFAIRDGVREHSGRLQQDELDVAFRQRVWVEGDDVHFAIEIEPQKTTPAEGAYVFVSVPVGDFAGGTVKIAEATPLPTEKSPQRHFASGAAKVLEISGKDRSLRLQLPSPVDFSVQDDRYYNKDDYTFYFPIARNELTQGMVHRVEFTITPSITADHATASITVNPAQALYKLAGFGGNFVYNPESPISQYNLDHLNVAWARTWMPLHEWEPINDNNDPTRTDLGKMHPNVRPGTRLHNSMEIARDLERRNIPYIISIWPVPGWMADKVDQHGASADGARVPRENWDELAESIGSYLVYARDQYGIEPQMFSFNEPDYGVRVKLSPEEHRDMIKHLGAYFEKLGLKTRMLGADVAHARGSHTYFQPTLDDPEAMRYVDAVAFHSWGGATPEQYAAWADLANRAKLPLMCTEAGPDAQAYRFQSLFHEYWYAHAEARQYQEMLLHARPQAILLWEYTSDYGIAKVEGQNPPKLTPTKRFHFIEQYSNSTPQNVTAIGARSDREQVLATAFRDAAGKLIIHLLNDGATRPANIAGLAANATYEVRVTDPDRDYEVIGEYRPGKPLTLPAWSLLTLTQKP